MTTAGIRSSITGFAMQPVGTYIFVMQLGNLTINGRVLLAPMAGVTDVVFRRYCRLFGAAIVYSEFLSSDGLAYNRMGQNHKLALSDDEHPVAYQLFGSKTETFATAAKALETLGPDLMDLNFGCPAKKVVKNSGGSAILKDIDLLARIVKTVVDAIDLPVTFKIRAGWDADHLVYVEAAQRGIEAGAVAVTLHARTKADGPWGPNYDGGARWEYITDLKKHISGVPVIGNGDVDSPESALRMLKETGCDAVMVGRAAIGRPWIFAEINHHLETGDSLPTPAPADRLIVAWNTLHDKVARSNNERGAVLAMRRMMSAFLRGLPGVHDLRRSLMMMESTEDIRRLFSDYVSEHPDLPREDGDDWLSRFVPIDYDILKTPKSGVVVK